MEYDRIQGARWLEHSRSFLNLMDCRLNAKTGRGKKIVGRVASMYSKLLTDHE